MKKKTKHEGGTCYFDALRFVEEHKDWTLVHGIPVLTGGKHAGEEYGHAWCEKGDMVYDASKKVKIPKVLYYAFGNINYAVRYSFKEAVKMVLKTKVYGAWDEKIKNALHS